MANYDEASRILTVYGGEYVNSIVGDPVRIPIFLTDLVVADRLRMLGLGNRFEKDLGLHASRDVVLYIGGT